MDPAVLYLGRIGNSCLPFPLGELVFMDRICGYRRYHHWRHRSTRFSTGQICGLETPGMHSYSVYHTKLHIRLHQEVIGLGADFIGTSTSELSADFRQ